MGDRVKAAKKDERRAKQKLTRAQKLYKRAKARTDRVQDRRKDIADLACLDGATLPLGLKLVLTDCREKGGWDGVVNAADRTKHADDCGNKSSQQELWDRYKNGTGNPANPPGSSTHEYVNGGNGGSPAYPSSRFKVGASLPWWGLGLDLSDSDGFIRACTKLGYEVFRAYMPREPWHFNFEENPRERLIKRGLI